LYTPDDNACMPGVTRNTIVHKLAPQEGIKCVEKRCSLAEFQSADEVFTTGTMGELTPVKLIDGRPIGEVNAEGQLINPITKKIQACYSLTTKIDAEV
jgi:branched-subunit amino acid aminotransferase/4-amino-4-deoxychorismate lyase